MARVVHFEIPASDPKRSADFYQKALGWKVEQWAGQPYWLVSTGDEKTPGINGGIMAKKDLKTTVNTVDVVSLEESLKAVLVAGGTLVRPKVAIPGVGWLAYCADPDGNVFGMMQSDEKAK